MFSKIYRKLDITSNWQIRCPTCGKTKSGRETRLVRVAPRSTTKRTLGRCTHCRGFKWLIIEAEPQEPQSGTSGS